MSEVSDIKKGLIFISYSNQDKDFVDDLRQRLSDHKDLQNVKAWVDRYDLHVGDDWKQTIDDTIRNAMALILIMSPRSKVSEYVTYEWSYALALNIPVFPLVIEPVTLHPRLASTHVLQFTPGHTTKSWNDLVDVLKLTYTKATPGVVVDTDRSKEASNDAVLIPEQITQILSNLFENRESEIKIEEVLNTLLRSKMITIDQYVRLSERFQGYLVRTLSKSQDK